MIVDRYLRREVYPPTGAVVALLLVMLTAFNLVRVTRSAEGSLLLPQELAEVLFWRGLIALEVLLPVALYVGVVVAFGRLYQDSEMDALRAAGLSRPRLVRPVFGLSLLLALIVALISLVGRPMAYQSIYGIRAAMEGADAVDRIEPGQFYRYEDLDRVVFVRGTGADGSLQQIFVRTRDGQDLEVIAAPAGRLTRDIAPGFHRLELEDAQVLRASPERFNLVGRFPAFALELPAAVVAAPAYRSKSADTANLWRSERFPDRAELEWRLSTGVSTLLLGLLAVPVSHSRPRQGRGSRLLLAIAIYAGYYLLLGLARTWLEQGWMFTAWWAPVLLAMVVAGLYYRDTQGA